MHHHIQASQPSVLVLGETTFRSQFRRFGMLEEDRLRHLYILGKTGTGKSTFLSQLIFQDLSRCHGLAVLDPHGPLVALALLRVTGHATNRTLVFRPADAEFPVAFNPFRAGRCVNTAPALLASNLVAVFKKQWSAFWGPRLEHVLRNAILAVAPDPRATLLFLYRFLTDETLRQNVTTKAQDPVVRTFWQREWPRYGARLQAEALSPVLNKLGAFLASPLVRNIVGQERSRVDLRALMDDGGVLLADLAVGQLGEDASHLLGGLLLSSLHLSALGRPPGSRPFFVYADEFQHFVTDSLASMLSEARKFGLSLTLAHQYLGQLPESLRSAVIGNTGSFVLFRLGHDDAQLLEGEVSPVFRAHDLVNLPSYHFAARLLVRGTQLAPFSARTLGEPPVPRDAEDQVERVIAQSRLRFATPRAQVERFVASTLPRA